MKNLGYIFLFFGRVILFPVYFLSGFVPRRENLWVFGSWGGHRFADNSAAFFLFCHEAVDDRIELVWVSRNREIVRDLKERGYSACWIWSPRGIVSALTAGLHIFDCFPKDTNYWLSRGAKRVNLWSGVPLKVFERDIDNRSSRYYRLFHGNIIERSFYGLMMPWHITRPDLAIATSDETAHKVSKAFGLQDSQVFVTGLPRNDAIFDLPHQEAQQVDKAMQLYGEAVSGDETVFLYLPTFRDDGTQFIDFDWDELNDNLGRKGAKLFFKSHPEDRNRYSADFPNIIQLTQEAEVSSLLPGADVLISDYSSVIFDFMLLGRPIIYYIPDLLKFETGCRSFNFHPREVAVGSVCESFDELLDALDQIAGGASSIASARRDEVMERMHTYCDARSSERVLDIIVNRFYGLRRNEVFVAQPGSVEKYFVQGDPSTGNRSQ